MARSTYSGARCPGPPSRLQQVSVNERRVRRPVNVRRPTHRACLLRRIVRHTVPHLVPSLDRGGAVWCGPLRAACFSLRSPPTPPASVVSAHPLPICPFLPVMLLHILPTPRAPSPSIRRSRRLLLSFYLALPFSGVPHATHSPPRHATRFERRLCRLLSEPLLPDAASARSS